MTFGFQNGLHLALRLTDKNMFISKIRWLMRTKSSYRPNFFHFQASSKLPLDSVKRKSLYLLCGMANQSFREIYTAQATLRKRGERKPVVYRNKSKLKPVPVWKNMTVQDLANALEKTVDEIFEAFLYVNDSESFDNPRSPITDSRVIEKTVKLVGRRFLYRPPKAVKALEEEEDSVQDAVKSPPAPPEELEPRPPIVTIMGHVDHGKTTLLDALRQSSIVESEFGGITQHIGAFEVFLPSGHQVTFLDTPGHAAFSAMRARGANVTDIVVLVVAADDGALQQTRESAEMARLSNTPIVVAINKIDKPEADIQRCEESLLNIGIQPESLGGDALTVNISALKGTNLPALVEALVTQAEVLDLKATKTGLVEGTVIESEMEPGKGKIATCIVQRGTLQKGAFLVSETSWARVRNLFNSFGNTIEKALPGTPVQVLGWRGSLPSAGAEILQVETEKRAKEVVGLRAKRKKKEKEMEDLQAIEQKATDHYVAYREQLEKKRELGIRFKMYRGRPPLEKQFKEDSSPRVSIVLKGDVDGSIEAILNVLDTYHSEECPIDLLQFGVGSVTLNDVEMAKAFKGIIYTFNVPLQREMVELAKREGVTVREHNIIYRLIEDLKEEISKRLPLLPEEDVVGEALVQEEFLVSEGRKKIPVAGCRCVKGTLRKELRFKVLRDLDVFYEGEVSSIRHLKKEVESIKKDVECGIRFDDPSIRFQAGDKILCVTTKMVPQTTDWSPEGF